ncbi:MAG: hypothetical protein ACOH16_10965 [Propionibacteriaceae bacterium]
MIAVYTSMLIPDSVVNGKFPAADEDKLEALGSHWTSVGTTLGSQSDGATTLSRTVFANWSGSGADTASAQITAVTRFAASTATATSVMSAGCAKAAAFVTNSKNGINAVLRQLNNMTKEQIAIGLANPLLIPVCVRNIVNLRAQAKSIIEAYSTALATAMGGISFAATIAPRPNRASLPTSTGSTGATTPTGATTSPTGDTRGGTTGTGSTGGTTGTGTTSTGSGGPTADPSSAWQGGLTDYRDGAPLDGLFDAPATTPAVGVGAHLDNGGSSAPDPTGSGTKDAGHNVPGGTADPSNAPGSGTAGTSGAQPTANNDPLNFFSNEQQGTDTTLSPTASPGQVPASLPAGQPPSIDSSAVTSVVKGDASAASVGLASPSITPGTHHGGGGGGTPATSTPQTPAPPTETRSQPLSVQPPSGGGHTAAPTGPTSGGYSGGHPTGAPGGGGMAQVVSQPIGTGAAGTAVAHNVSNPIMNAPPIIAPPASSGAFMGGGGSTGGVTSIQIGPGGSGPVTNLGGGVGSLAAPAATGAITGVNAGPVTSGGAPALSSPVAPAAPAAPSGAVPPSSLAGPGANAPAPVGQASTVSGPQVGPPVSAAQPLRIPSGQVGAGEVTPTGAESTDADVVPVALAIAALGLVGTAARHFAGLWQDLGASSMLRPAGAILPTQFGRDDELVAALPAGLDAVYQKVLLPGEVDQLFAGQIETLRGLVHPYHAVRDLRTPAQLYDALGLGFAITGLAGSDTLAFNRDAESVEVLRCAGLRPDDLVTPVDADVHLPPGTVPVPLVRHHKRPWSGTGEAPGSTSDNIIDEHEVLGYASVAIPHLAEIWRLHTDGREDYVSTYNQRNGQWLGDTTPSHQPIGRRLDNGGYAALGDGTVYRTVLLTDRHSVLIAYGVSAPEHFEQAHDGSYRITVANTDLVSLMGVTTIGTWQGCPVQLLHRQGSMLLVDYAGDHVAAAAAAGFVQVSQGQWQPRWVEHAEVSDVRELERPYALPQPLPGTTAPAPDPSKPQHGHLSETVASGTRA